MPRAVNEYARVPIDRVSDSPLDDVGLRCASMCLGYLLLVQPSAGQLGGVEIPQESPELSPGANKLAPIFAFASAEQVLP